MSRPCYEMPGDPRDYKLDLATGASTAPAKPFLGVKFACCGTYTRIYRHSDGVSYRGRCPRCGLPVTFKVGEGGTHSRFFIVQ